MWLWLTKRCSSTPAVMITRCRIFVVAVVCIYLFAVNRDATFFSLQSRFRGIVSSDRIRYIAVTAVTSNPRYLFVLPLSVAQWQKLGVETVIFAVGNETELTANRRFQLTMDLAQKYGGTVVFLQNKQLSPTTLAQTSRIFASALPFSADLDPDTTAFITTDADIVPFHRHLHVLPNDSRLHVFYPDCCGHTSLPKGPTVKHFPIGTTTATVNTWREIMNFSDASNFTSTDIEFQLISAFGKNFFHPDDDTKPGLVGSTIWYSDQRLLSDRIDKWRRQFNTTYTSAALLGGGKPKRVDRIHWPKAAEFSKSTPDEWDDAHMPTAAYQPDQWINMLPFLEFLLGKDTPFYDEFLFYREAYLQVE